MTELEWRRKFAERLRYYLDEYKMSQTELADRIFVGRSTISNYLSCRITPSIKAISNIAYVLDCDIRDLIDFDEKID